MIERFKNYPINWVDGMKINKQHFIQMQHNVDEQSRDSKAVFLNKLNYGLLPNEESGDSAKLSIIPDHHGLLQVTVNECYAVTQNGTRIEIENTHPLTEKQDLKNLFPDDTQTDLVLFVNIKISPNEKDSFGVEDPNEDPPRAPFLRPKYSLEFKNEASVVTSSGYEITIGKLKVTNKVPTLEQNYIPPCTTVNSHPRLLDMCVEIETHFTRIEEYCIQISQKINTKGQTSNLSEMVLGLSEKFMNYLGTTINQIRWFSAYEPPAYLLDKVVALARTVKSYVDSKSGSGKEELLNYFTRWLNFSQAEFEGAYSSVINIQYKHEDIAANINVIMNFLVKTEEIFTALNRLNYIGEQGDTGIFVKETPHNHEVTKTNRNRSFLED